MCYISSTLQCFFGNILVFVLKLDLLQDFFLQDYYIPVFVVEGNISYFKFYSLIQCCMFGFFLERYHAYVRFILHWNVLINNVLVFVIEENLACTRFVLACNVVVGNMLLFVLQVNITHFAFISLRNVFIECAYVCDKRKSSISYICFPLQYCCWHYACVCANSKSNTHQFFFTL